MARTKTLRAGVLIGAIAASVLAPATAEAAGPRVYCLQAYAETLPSKCDPTTFRFEPPPPIDTVTPLSDPFGTLNPLLVGVIVVEGNATPDSLVTVTISDGQKSIVRNAVAAPTADFGSGDRAGDFEIVFDPARDFSQAPLTVQELGVHAAAPNADPSSTDPFDLGRSVLTVTAIAKQNNMASAPMTTEIIKLAATPNDFSSPEFRDLRFPPQHWCRYAGEGMRLRVSSGEVGAEGDLGGGHDGTCSYYAVNGVGAVPDVTWVACTELTETIEAGDDPTTPEDESTPISTQQDTYCRKSADHPTERHNFPRQQAPLAGQVIDGPDGGASEIKTVTITITQGEGAEAEVIRTYTDWFARNTSTTGSWGFSLKIDDLSPTWPDKPPYRIMVSAEDAWGNHVEETSHPINIYPY